MKQIITALLMLISLAQRQIPPAIEIVGSVTFTMRTHGALNMLDRAGWLDYAADGVKHIVQRDSDSRFIPETQTYFTTSMVAETGGTLHWYACTIVHEARHMNQLRENLPFWGAESEADANATQRQCLIDTGAPASDIEWLDYVTAEMLAGRLDTWSEPHDY
jgi:hypothetical protein